MNIDKSIKKNIETIRNLNGNSFDIIDREFTFNKKKVAYIYYESVCSEKEISDFIARSLSYDIKNKKISAFSNLFNYIKNTISISKYKIIDNFEELFPLLSNGFICLFVEGTNKSIVMEAKAQLDRGVSEPTSNTSIIGPKDSFTENHLINIGLIRKRIKDHNLFFDEIKVGKRSKTKIAVAYIADIAEEKKVNIIKNKLKLINTDAILDSGYIREFITQKSNSTFPRIVTSERPDIVCGSLLEGKIAIIVENSPYVLVIPAILIDFFHSPEDYYQKANNVSFTRSLRLIAFFLTVLGPGFYIALTTFNQELIPDQLLISLAAQRNGVPFPTVFEVIFMFVAFEILRESDIRTPNPMGTAISIVGALILGEAAVDAGVVSPIVVIIVALTSISTLVFNDIEFINAIRWWRLFFIILSACMGTVGFAIGILLFTIKLCSLESLGVAYTTPFSPFYKNSLKDTIIRSPRNNMTKRPSFLTKNITRGDKIEN